MSVNLKSYAFCAKGAIPAMRKAGGGSIVNVASVRSIVVGGGTLQYDTAKHAVAGLTRGLAIDHGAEGIRVNCIAPGLVKTEFARALWDDPKFLRASEQSAALGRIAGPDEMAGAVVYFASAASSFVTGQTLVMDGGRLL